jgi:peptidoglycan/LPS O-acetylase OafA/YrhL
MRAIETEHLGPSHASRVVDLSRQDSVVPVLGEQLPSLTPLRGIAALWVVIYHYVVTYFSSLHTEHYTQIFAKGYLAVDLFFLLSGFVLTHVYQEAFTRSIGANYREFLFARVARLYPLHVFVLLLFLTTAMATQALRYATTGQVGSIPLEGARSLSAAVANLFMVQGLKASELSWNYPAWSVSVEFIAYLGFPFALPLIWKARWRGRAVLGLMLVGVLAYFAYLTKDDFNQWDGPQTLVRCLPEFLLGTVLYGAYRGGLLPVAIRGDAV